MTAFVKKIKLFFKEAVALLKASAKGFSEDKVPKLSSSLAYCTVFSIAPLLTIVIATASIIYSKDAIEGKLHAELTGFVGAKLAGDIELFVANAELSGKNMIALIIGGITLIIGATAVFTEIQDSINTIWNVKAVPEKGWKKLVANRLLSFSLIVSLGFLLLVSLVISTVLTGLQHELQQYLSFSSLSIFKVVSLVVTFLVITLLFAVIFKVLPDVQLKWKPALMGAGFTAVLFMVGKFLIQLYVTQTNTGAVFGAAGSVVVFMVWVYYTALILYFGAEFTEAYAERYQMRIRPSKYAVHLKTVVETIEPGPAA
ncbi:YihY/virulence factor BrkB family protein [Niabella beijingensis]|uniref:YihY/virulence factor BrkB family protein n=1 Tax=Niabella beijingensis TaxID=2872700 RepID=UPI001CBE3A22|nr:YihY/virulence factor BrkB family protein [Niabella beijingensis]MBZ4192586.1 YihY/virulence factor BrkB family protein [Niabella beijingensis]